MEDNEYFSILVVDDESLLANRTKQLLKPLGYFVSTAFDRQTCLSLVHELHPDIILLDVKLGHDSGIDVAHEIKELHLPNNPFVILYSALLVATEHIQAGLSSGADGYIIRTIPETEFLHWIKTYIRIKKTENKLVLKETSCKTIVQTMTEGVICHDNDGGIMDLNPAAEEILGRSRDEILGYKYEEINMNLIREDGVTFFSEDLPHMRALQTGEVIKGLVIGFFHPKKQEMRWIEADCVPFPHTPKKTGPSVYTLFSDITKRKQRDSENRKLSQRLQAGMKAGNLAWWEMELPSGRVIFGEEKALMIGFPPTLFTTYQDFTRLIHSDDFEPAMQAMRDHLEGRKEIYDVEYRIKTKSGRYKWFRDVGRISERDSDKNRVRVVGIVQDITKRKLSEEETKKSKKQLIELSHHLQTVREDQNIHIANEMHDNLGQSLSLLEMLLTLLEEDTSKKQIEDSKIRSLLSEIRSQVNTLTNGVQNIAKEYRPSILDTAGICEALIWLVDQYKRKSSIRFITKIPVSELTLGPERDLALFRIVQEAFTNVLRHARATEVKLSVELKSDDLSVQIEDNGIGFTVDESDELNGFGVISMKERALFCGGTIRIKSEKNNGTLVQAECPLKEEDDTPTDC